MNRLTSLREKYDGALEKYSPKEGLEQGDEENDAEDREDSGAPPIKEEDGEGIEKMDVDED